MDTDSMSEHTWEIKGAYSPLSEASIEKILAGPHCGDGARLPSRILSFEAQPQNVVWALAPSGNIPGDAAVLLSCLHMRVIQGTSEGVANLVRHGFPMRCRKCEADMQEFTAK